MMLQQFFANLDNVLANQTCWSRIHDAHIHVLPQQILRRRSEIQHAI
jgi:hypothetical protein